MEDERENRRAERRSILSIPVPWSGKSIEVRSMHAVLLLLVILTGGVASLLWVHVERTSEVNSQYITAMEFVSKAIQNSTAAQREFACLISVPQEQRERAWETGKCRRMARIGDE